MKYYVTVNGRNHVVQVIERLGELEVQVDGAPYDVSYEEVDDLGQVVLNREGKSFGLSIEGDESKVSVTLAGHFYEVLLEDERERAAHAAERAGGKHGGVVHSVMPGVVVEVLVQRGTVVEKGQALLILAAMKMQNEILAPSAGTVREVHVAAGVAVSAGAKLISLEPAG